MTVTMTVPQHAPPIVDEATLVEKVNEQVGEKQPDEEALVVSTVSRPLAVPQTSLRWFFATVVLFQNFMMWSGVFGTHTALCRQRGY